MVPTGAAAKSQGRFVIAGAPVSCHITLGQAKHTLKGKKCSGVHAAVRRGELLSPWFAGISHFFKCYMSSQPVCISHLDLVYQMEVTRSVRRQQPSSDECKSDRAINASDPRAHSRFSS